MMSVFGFLKYLIVNSYFFKDSLTPLGIEDRTITDKQVNASSSSSNKHLIGLNSHHFWHSYEYHPWVQVDFETPKTLTGILIQGESTRTPGERVTSLRIKVGNETTNLHFITHENGKTKVCFLLMIFISCKNVFLVLRSHCHIYQNF